MYLSDTRLPLSVVSGRYRTVQPSEILEFYRDLPMLGGFELETVEPLHLQERAMAFVPQCRSYMRPAVRHLVRQDQAGPSPGSMSSGYSSSKLLPMTNSRNVP